MELGCQFNAVSTFDEKNLTRLPSTIGVRQVGVAALE